MKRDPYAALRLLDVRRMILANAFFGFGSRGLAVVIGFQVYSITGKPLSLGLLGLVEAIPSLSLALYGGHVADHKDRRMLVLLTGIVSVACAALFAMLSLTMHEHPPVEALYGVVFLAGIARGFNRPAGSAFEAQVVPRDLYVNASAWSSSVSQIVAVAGPALAGVAYAYFHAGTTYALIAGLELAGCVVVYQVDKRPLPDTAEVESVWESVKVGVRYVARSQPLLASMALDLFAVFFGGAIALLPVFAKDVLKVGPTGFGYLNAAPAIGALPVMLWATQHPSLRRAGMTLLVAVAGFGVTMIVFGFSRNFYISFAALVFSGVFDGISMVIRQAIERLLTPDALRGRVAAVGWVFVGSSNELGALESGIAAKILGATRAVWAGGILTLFIVAGAAGLAPKLRNLNLEEGNAHPPSS